MLTVSLVQYDAIKLYVEFADSKKAVMNNQLSDKQKEGFQSLAKLGFAKLGKNNRWSVGKKTYMMYKNGQITFDDTPEKPTQQEGEKPYAFIIEENVRRQRLYYVYAKSPDEAEEKIKDYDNVYKEASYGDPRKEEILDFDVKELIIDGE